MFGFISAAPQLLCEEQRARYRACYCGLCRAIKERHGELSRLTLSYDMTFLVLLLSSLYEPEEKSGSDKCIAHPAKEHEWWRSPVTDYAADMNVALSYLKCMDDWNDDSDLVKLAAAKSLKPAFQDIALRYPRQCEAMKKSMDGLSEIEKDLLTPKPDAASACFGRLMAELFVLYEDRWAPTLRSLGDGLGRFIYIMDACIDLKGDKRYYRYNPMKPLFGALDEEKRFRDILEMLLGGAVRAFDALPLVQDAALMKNILSFGVWNQFNKHYNVKGAPPDDTGPL